MTNQYVNYQSILNAALGHFQEKGFRLVEDGDHATILFFKDERVGIFSQTGMTLDALKEECEAWLKKVEAGR